MRLLLPPLTAVCVYHRPQEWANLVGPARGWLGGERERGTTFRPNFHDGARHRHKLLLYVACLSLSLSLSLSPRRVRVYYTERGHVSYTYTHPKLCCSVLIKKVVPYSLSLSLCVCVCVRAEAKKFHPLSLSERAETEIWAAFVCTHTQSPISPRRSRAAFH